MSTATDAKVARRKAEQLGMPFGTAAHRLRKMLLYRALTQLKQTACFKCGADIESPDDVSIEHKKPWLDVSPALFWDLDNVTFSHKKCNVVDRPRGGGSNRRIGPIGQEWCSRCRKPVAHDGFALSSRNHWRNFKHDTCKACYNAARKITRARNRGIA